MNGQGQNRGNNNFNNGRQNIPNANGNAVPSQSVPQSQVSSVPQRKDQGPQTSSHVGSFTDSLKKSRSPFSSSDGGNQMSRSGALRAGDPLAKAGLSRSGNKEDGQMLRNIRQKNAMQQTPRGARNQNQGDNNTEEETNKSERAHPRIGDGFPKPNLLGSEPEEEESDGEGEEESSGFAGGIFSRRRRRDGFNLIGRAFGKISLPVKIGIVVAACLVVVVATIAALIPTVFSNSHGVSQTATNLLTSDEEVTFSSSEEESFYTRLQQVSSEYSGDNRVLVGQAIAAVFTITSADQATDYDYEDMTEEVMRNIASMMFPDGSTTYDEAYFQQQLASNFFPNVMPGESEEYYQQLAEEVTTYLTDYRDMITDDDASVAVSTGGSCTYNVGGLALSNVKVRLMQSGIVVGHDLGGTYGEPIAGEELVDFEKYVLGVAYAEIGPVSNEQAFKSQLLMARSFALARFGPDAYQENGAWILEIPNSVAAQVYCDPDQGCSKDVPANNQWGMVYSGANSHAYTYKDAMAQDDIHRTWADEVAGQVIVDDSGNVVLATYGSSTNVEGLANSLGDYVDVLVHIYGSITIESMNCTSSSNATYASWKQNDPTWSGIVLGGGSDSTRSLGNIGCLATSISMLIMKSGALNMTPTPTLVNSSNFNPGTFVQAMNQVGGFDSGGNLIWSAVNQVVPAFRVGSDVRLSGLSQQEKLETIRNYAGVSGNYCTIEVKGATQGAQHWVAIDNVTGNSITMMDPASESTDAWATYNWYDTSRIVCFTTN